MNRNTNKAAIKNDTQIANIKIQTPKCIVELCEEDQICSNNEIEKFSKWWKRCRLFRRNVGYTRDYLDIQKKGIFFNIHTKRLFSPKLLNSNIYTWVSLGLINVDVYDVIHKFFLSISMIFRIFVFKSSSCPASEERTKIK